MPAIPKPESAQQARARRKRDAAQLLARVRELVTARDRVCRLCGDAWPLEVHHIKFRSAGGEHSTQNCLLLCRRCHRDAAHTSRYDIVPVDPVLGADGEVNVHARPPKEQP